MVFVLDQHQKPLMPCTEKRARLLLARGRARVHKMAPFTIRLIDRLQENSTLQDLRLKLDPGSKTTGVALTLNGAHGTHVLFLGEIAHRTTIKMLLDKRRTHRQGRRFRHTRYRPARFQNRKRPAGWLPPSLTARVDQTLHAVKKMTRGAPITALSVEHVRFDTQKMQNPEIRGVEYQQGTLLGYEVREYLLDKWGRACAYCDATNGDLQVEHIHPKARGGSDRVSNLTMACPQCNDAKDTRSLEEFLTQDKGRRQRALKNAHHDAGNDLHQQQYRARWETERFTRIQRQKKAPLKDAAMMNATRWRLYHQLQATGLPVEGGSGGRTKKQRIEHELPKEHYYDALCVGKSTPDRFTPGVPTFVQIWSAKGRGTRQICRTDKHGFPIRYVTRSKRRFGFQTGDLVHVHKAQGVHAGMWTGRLTARPDGRFVVTTADGLKVEVPWHACRLLQRGDGWQYSQRRITAESVGGAPPCPEGQGPRVADI